MIYLSGTSRPELVAIAGAASVGLIVQPRSHLEGQIGAYRWWAADTGCYARGDTFEAASWIRWLARLPRQGCLFATAPDVVADMEATLWRSEPWLAKIRSLGLRAALVAQDGAERLELPWDRFDVLFVGGSTSWKLSSAAQTVMVEARRRGCPLHMGRVNSLRRMQAAALMGCTSVDGTFIAHRARQNGGDRGLREVVEWLRRLGDEPFLPLGGP